MYPELSFKQQTGAGLPVAVFVITVLALLVIGMAQLQESSANSVSFQVQSQRAFLAAESGAQLGVGRALQPISGPQCFSGTFSFTVGGLKECSAIVSCFTNAPGQGVVIRSEGRCGISTPSEGKRTVEVRLL